MSSEVTARNLEFNEADHPRNQSGPQGGEFTSGTGTSSSTKRAPLTPTKGYRIPGSGSSGSTTVTVKPPAPKGKATLRAGANNDPEAVKQLQALIAELGLGNTAIDGVFGPHTTAAVKAIQTKLGLKATGSASPALVRRLIDAHTLSPCVDRSASQVTAAYDSSGSEEEHTGAMVALVPAAPDTLAVEDGEPVDELHCTLLYLGEAADYDDDARDAVTAAVADIAAAFAPFDADGFAVCLFNPDSDERDPCIVLGLSGAELAEVHDAVAAEIEAAPEQHEPWIPHLTLIYDADPSMVAELTDRTGPVRFNAIRVAFGDEVIDYPLGAGAVAAGHPYPGQRYRHGWIRVGGPGGVRQQLMESQTLEQIELTTRQELRAIMGRTVTVYLDGLEPQLAREYAEGVLRGAERFPETKLTAILTADTSTYLPDRAYAHARPASGEIVFDNTKTAAEIDREVKAANLATIASSGRHFAGPEGVHATTGLHEFAHLVHGPDSNVQAATHHAIKRYAEEHNLSMRGAAHTISEYAADSTSEALAEALVDVMFNDGGSELSQALVALLPGRAT